MKWKLSMCLTNKIILVHDNKMSKLHKLLFLYIQVLVFDMRNCIHNNRFLEIC